MIEALLPLSPAALQATMDRGDRVPAATLAGAWYRGTSLGLWGWVEALAWKTFAKAFHPVGDTVVGWNVRVHQDGLGAPLRPQLRRGRPHVFGHYRAMDTPEGLVLDYRRGPNPALDPTRLVLDPIVALGPGVLLGRTWIALGSRRVPTPSFFLLERQGVIPAEVRVAAGR